MKSSASNQNEASSHNSDASNRKGASHISQCESGEDSSGKVGNSSQESGKQRYSLRKRISGAAKPDITEKRGLIQGGSIEKGSSKASAVEKSPLGLVKQDSLEKDLSLLIGSGSKPVKESSPKASHASKDSCKDLSGKPNAEDMSEVQSQIKSHLGQLIDSPCDQNLPLSNLQSQQNASDLKSSSLDEQRLARRRQFNLRGNLASSQLSRMKESQNSKAHDHDSKNTQGRWSREEHEKFIEETGSMSRPTSAQGQVLRYAATPKSSSLALKRIKWSLTNTSATKPNSSEKPSNLALFAMQARTLTLMMIVILMELQTGLKRQRLASLAHLQKRQE
ncbi:hypothetical protein FGO68_gene16057 [Halteria grandinella]|uniref:Uncharacterized protein n=1 Tax=Halteria grandinella TaxID=5974 RepID=A0A8J8NZF0_HALGN|nr:hypothetical protein FGO68_gene16057 [Halteria grandinella]